MFEFQLKANIILNACKIILAIKNKLIYLKYNYYEIKTIYLIK